MNEAREIYLKNISELQLEETNLSKKRKLIGWARFLTIVALIVWMVKMFKASLPILIVGIVLLLILFLVFVAIDVKWKTALLYTQSLLKVNRRELDGLDGKFSTWESGDVFNDPTHAYLSDLDVFGNFSIFQYVNRANTSGGKKVLAQWFKEKADNSIILQRQKATQYLSKQLSFRQDVDAVGLDNPIDENVSKLVDTWTKLPNPLAAGAWNVVKIVYPIITLSTLFLYLNDSISGGMFSLAVLVFLIFSFAQTKKITASYDAINKLEPKIATLSKQLSLFENLKVEGELLVTLQNKLRNENISASKSIADLRKILEKFDVRMNVFLFFFLNAFLLWDVWVTLALNKWKTAFGDKVSLWLNTVYEVEALNSLGTLTFNHPDWIFPTINDTYFNMAATEIGHPLIAASKRVNNSFAINGQDKIALITGSNMGGKSTFLRSLGVNLILANCGAPVCAQSMTVSPTKLMSSMRIADNLAENTSTFYAELKKLKQIIEAVNGGEKVFVLLDEILRGTNSLDRHAGSKALMTQLIEQKVVAVIATHDVELASMQNDYPGKIENYHFDVQVAEDQQLYFDYKLKNGICQRMNAAILMREIGIKM
ncbi:MutS-related protein [Rhizosphaericola mali]|uniref:DNA mismatch repair proteins mutS family domain-containing protein n=1 Tax=Rhizosphaericola mali TaxID=2545455 RepID=A0A5P2G308_9BACT|nr:hypothetical protein [Rhizosphaericola mali]QES89587.1 hypothetical protein E0W69_013255 [Rhizosphaericola mali]